MCGSSRGGGRAQVGVVAVLRHPIPARPAYMSGILERGHLPAQIDLRERPSAAQMPQHAIGIKVPVKVV
jgi:hypothetical protein